MEHRLEVALAFAYIKIFEGGLRQLHTSKLLLYVVGPVRFYSRDESLKELAGVSLAKNLIIRVD
jgi:hypothetical protein